MTNPTSESSQPIMLQTAEPFRDEADSMPRPRLQKGRPGLWTVSAAAAFSAFWIGSCTAYLFGYYGLAGTLQQAPPELVLLAVVTFLPPLLLLSAAWALGRGIAMGRAAESMAEATDRLFSADEFAARTAARLGRAVRREIDALNTGLDNAFTRLRSLETALEQQIAAVDEASARIGVQGEAVAARLTQERERVEAVMVSLSDSAARAGETVAGRAAQLKATVESAEGALKTAGQSLDTQAANFRQAAVLVAEAPRNAAIELDSQAKRIESVSDAAMARAEFVLGRHERHRTAMMDLLQRLKEDSASFEGTLGAQRAALERAVGLLEGEAQRFEHITEDTDRKIGAIISNASTRSEQFTQTYAREVVQLRETSEAAGAALANLVDSMREAGTGAQALLGETTSQARADAKSLVSEAMAECERLLRAAGEMAVEAQSIRDTMAKSTADIERHLLNLPVLAEQEAQRVRQMVRSETEEMFDLSARTLAKIQARTEPRPSQRPPAQDNQPLEEPESDGLLGLAKRLTQRPKKKPVEIGDIRERETKSWEMSALLAAAGGSESETRELKSGAVAAIGALQAALADLAIDLEAIVVDAQPTEETWRRYLAGDRASFAHKIAEAIDDRAVDRIAALYRDDSRFRDAANNYLLEFEVLLARAKEGDGNGLLASSILSADTGKIYLAVAYALGRL